MRRTNEDGLSADRNGISDSIWIGAAPHKAAISVVRAIGARAQHLRVHRQRSLQSRGAAAWSGGGTRLGRTGLEAAVPLSATRAGQGSRGLFRGARPTSKRLGHYRLSTVDWHIYEHF